MLRTRLTLGLVCLLVILLAMGLYSINQCGDLGRRIEIISRDNDRSGLIIQQMKRSGAAMTGALLSVVTNDQAQSSSEFNTARKSFLDALNSENARASTSPEEKKEIAKILEAYKSYDDRARAFLQSSNDPGGKWRTTAHKLGHDTSDLLDMVDQLAIVHEQGLTSGTKETHDDVVSTIRSLILLMITAATVAIYASMRLSRGLLQPLVSVTSSIRQVGEGNLDQTVPVVSTDELGILATSFNQMAAQLRQYKANTSEELMRLTMTIRSTLASFPDPIFVLNSLGAVEFRNPEADQLAVKLLFSGVTRLPQKVDEKVEQVRASGQDYLPTLFKDAIKFHLEGQDHYFLPRIVLLRDDSREVFGVAVILENVTRMLLLDDVKSNLIATVSHELKTPLTSVRMALYLLHEKAVGALNDKQSDLVLTAREDADRLLKTLNDLLDLAKLEQGAAQLDLKDIPPEEMVKGAAREMREISKAAEVTLKTEIRPGLPEVHIDRQRMDYVLTNLIGNAIKYSPAGTEILVRVEMGKTRIAQPGVRFSVTDHGPGISEEHQEHIFERFYRVPGTSKSGAGLGLSIAREVVAIHEGEIGVISFPGQGSEFFFVLPFVLKPEAAIADGASKDTASKSGSG
jgi:two-component system, NtrC family, sensor histidine kinase KinB